ncbi:MAG: exodeoxyribonuclease I [Gammaproteobacteria bacterium]|nr:exodeoxyribonuclease I [Gammaproteobacteria bacterium]
MNYTYLFYDLETSGLNKAFDQVLQFAAIRTDHQFNELNRINLFIKLNPDTIPSPAAILTHQISMDDLSEKGICEYEAIKQIHLLLNEPGSISLGYNTLGFDDEFLRFSFYRNLFPPYTHQHASGCSRADLYPMVVIYYLYKHDLLNWPENGEKISLKLENLIEKNHLVEGDAHDAMVDVEATVQLAKILSRDKSMWDYLMSGFLRPIDVKRGALLKESLMIDGQFGARAYFQSYVLNLGRHYHYKNQTLWLRLDDVLLEENKNLSFIKDEMQPVFTEGKILENFMPIIRRKDAEPKFLLPLEKRFLSHFDLDRLKIVSENKKWLHENQTILEAIKNYYLDYKYPIIPNLDVDAALYQTNFLTYEEQNLCRQFHQLSPDQKGKFIEHFENKNLKEQAIRILGRNYPQCLPEKYNYSFEDYLKKINPRTEEATLIDYRYEKRLTPQKALEEIQAVQSKAQLNERQNKLLDRLKIYVETQFGAVEI